MRRRTLLLGSLLTAGLCASTAQAFSEPLLYSEDALNGGGGGRFFTGAPLDGYSCSVCHEGGAAPSVSVSGFPLSYVPGQTYQVAVTWTQPTSPHALNLEVVDTSGRATGVLALPLPEDVGEDDLCILSDDEAFRSEQASSLVESGARRIVAVRGCGARSLHFSFTAPDQPKALLAASVVRSDKSADTHGDGVLALRLVGERQGQARAWSSAESCGISPVGQSSESAAAVIALLGAWLWRRSRLPSNRDL